MEMEEEEDDTHICLACHSTILGLDNYVKHKKIECPAKKNAIDKKSQHPTTTARSALSVDVSGIQGGSTSSLLPPLTESGFSPPGIRVIDANLGLYDHVQVTTAACSTTTAGSYLYNNPVTTTGQAGQYAAPNSDPAMISDFFSSLELQSTNPSQSKAAPSDKLQTDFAKSPDPFHPGGLDSFEHSKHLFDNSKALKLVSILNDLDFSSDSEGFNEDFLNFSDMDDELDNTASPRAHVGGKWRPGMHHSPGRLVASKGGKGKHGGKMEAYHKHAGKLDSFHNTENKGTVAEPRGKLDAFKEVAAAEQDSAKSSIKEMAAVEQESAKSSINGEGHKHHRGFVGKLEAHKKHQKFDKIAAYKRAMEQQDEEAMSDTDYDNLDQSLSPKRRKHSGKSQLNDQSPVSQAKSSQASPRRSQTGNKRWPGKRWPMSEVEEEEEEEEDKEPKDKEIYHCNPCKRKFTTKSSFERHLTCKLHKKRCLGVTNKEKKISEVTCPICDKKFKKKLSFARHLVSPCHMKRILPLENKVSAESAYLNEGMQILLLKLKPFQCRVCGFYCNDKDDFQSHLASDAHGDKCVGLLGPLVCNHCKFWTRDPKEMYEHFLSAGKHDKTKGKYLKLNIVRELRNQVPCGVCGKIIHSATQLSRHMSMQHGGKEKKNGREKPRCPHCKVLCTSAFAMTIHIRRKHTRERPFKCTFCVVDFADNSSLTLHKKSQRHLNRLADLSEDPSQKSKLSMLSGQGGRNKIKLRRNRTYKCDHCFFQTADHDLLRPHYLEAHANDTLNCDICGLTFLRDQWYQKHLKSVGHAKKVKAAEKDGSKLYTCKWCDRKFYEETTYKIHEIFHKWARVNKEDMAMILSDLDEKYHDFVQNFKFDENFLHGKFQCPECNKRIHQDRMLVHLRMHSNKDPYQCLFCKKGWKDRGLLVRHIRGHFGFEKLNCEYCEKRFNQKRYLKRHMLLKHREKAGDVKLYQCDVCGRECIDKSTLNLHLQIHGGKNVKCPFEGCRLSFRQKSELTVHYRVHTGERPFLCDVCGYGGKTRTQLNRHRRTHTQERKYQCEYCTYKSPNSTNLRRHMRIHIGSKPYQCPYCDHRSNCVENIRKHILKTKQHAGKVIYPCKQCAFGTNSAKEIREHLMDIHHLSSKEVEVSSVYTGLYEKDTDIRSVPEGSLVHPVRDPEAKPRNKTPKHTQGRKHKKQSGALGDHIYSHIDVKKETLQTGSTVSVQLGPQSIPIETSYLLANQAVHIIYPTNLLNSQGQIDDSQQVYEIQVEHGDFACQNVAAETEI